MTPSNLRTRPPPTDRLLLVYRTVRAAPTAVIVHRAQLGHNGASTVVWLVMGAGTDRRLGTDVSAREPATVAVG